VAVVLGVLVVVGRLSGEDSRPATLPTVTTVRRPTLSLPATMPSSVTAQLRFGNVAAVTATAAGDAVWAAHGCAVFRVDPHTNQVVATVGLPPIPDGCWVAGMAAGAGALWVSQSGARLVRIDPRVNRVVATVPLPQLATPAATAGGVWGVCCWSGINSAYPAGWLVRVDPATNRVVARIRLGGLPTAVGVGSSGVWVTGAGGPIWRVDPGSGRVVATVRVPGGLGGLPGRPGPLGEVGEVLVGAAAVWVSNPASGQVLRVDPARNRLVGAASTHDASIVGAQVGPSLVAAGGRVWATSWITLLALGGQARRVSLDDLAGRQDESEPISDLAASPGAIWVGAWKGLFRVDLARLRRAGAAFSG